MRNLVILFTVLLISCGSKTKIAVYNGDEVWVKHPLRAKVDSIIKAFPDTLEIRHNQLLAKSLELKAEIDNTTDGVKRDSLSKEYKDVQYVLGNWAAYCDAEFQLLMDSVERSVVSQMEVVLKDVAKDEGYDLIINRTSATHEVFPYASRVIDITDKVKEQVKKIR